MASTFYYKDYVKCQSLAVLAGTGTVNFGEDDSGIDVKFFGATASAYALWDQSADALILNKADIQLGDTDFMMFGDATGGDVSVNWTGTALQISPATDDTGSINIGNGTADIDFKVFLGSTSDYMLADVGNSMVSVAKSTAATTGTIRAFDVAQTHTAVGANAEVLRATLTSNVALGSWGNAIMGRVDLSTTGLVSGLIGCVCAELNMPGGTVAGSAGTYAAFEAEINCPTSYDSTVPIHVFQINSWGAAKAKFDANGFLFDLTGVTSGASSLWYDNQKAAPAVEEFIRVKTPSGTRYIGLYNANA